MKGLTAMPLMIENPNAKIKQPVLFLSSKIVTLSPKIKPYVSAKG